MEKQFYKQWWFWTIMAIIVVVIIFGDGNGKAKTTSTSQTATQSSATDSSSSASTSNDQSEYKSIDFSTAQLTEDNVRKAVDQKWFLKKADSVKVDNGNITVSIFYKNYSNVKSLLENAQPDSADVFEALFKNKNVNQVTYVAQVGSNDKYGNTIKKTAITCTLTKDEADKISEWKNFKKDEVKQYFEVVKYSLGSENDVQGLKDAWSIIYGK